MDNKELELIKSYLNHIQCSLQKFHAIRLLDVKVYMNDKTKNHIYGNHFTSNIQVEYLNNAIHYALSLNSKINSDYYVPHIEYRMVQNKIKPVINKSDIRILLDEIEKEFLDTKIEDDFLEITTKYTLKRIDELYNKLIIIPQVYKDKVDVTKNVIDAVTNLESNISSCFGIIEIKDLLINDETYSHFQYDSLIKEKAFEIIYFSLKLLKEMYTNTQNNNFVPHTDYRKVDTNELNSDELLSLAIILEHFQKCTKKNLIKNISLVQKMEKYYDLISDIN